MSTTAASSLLDTAILLCQRGFWVVPTIDKQPYSRAWGAKRKTEAELRSLWKPGAGPGICLGPDRAPGGGWLIDLEGDGPQAEQSYLRLVGGELVETFGWTSARGSHALFVADGPRLLSLLVAAGAIEGKGHDSGKYVLPEFPDLELRIGGHKPDGSVKQFQSVAPPTPGTDGAPRRWNYVDAIAELPETAYATLEAIGERQAIQSADQGGQTPPQPVILPINAPFQATVTTGPSVEERARAYARTIDPAISGQRGHDKAFYSACKIGPGFDLPTDLAYRILAEEYNPRCQPPWSENDLRRKVDEAYKVEKCRGWLLSTPSTNGHAARTVSGQGLNGVIDYTTLSESELGIEWASEIEDEPIDWIDPQRLARGKFHLTAGAGGNGKSQYTIAEAAGISKGGTFPSGARCPIVGKVLILAAEDGRRDTIKPRLFAAGADMANVGVMKLTLTITDKNGKVHIDPINFQNLDYWDATIQRIRPTLIIADPIPAFLGRGVNDHRNADVRAILEPFAALLERHGVAFEAITHVGKSSENRSAADRVLGSVAYTNLARRVNIAWADPDTPGRYILTNPKNSLGPKQQAIGYTIEEFKYEKNGKVIVTSRAKFEADQFDADEYELMNGQKRSRGPAPVAIPKLAKFLVEFMRGKGPVFLGEIADAAGEAGLIGKRKQDDKTGRFTWSQYSNLYEAVRQVPKLQGELAGWIIETSREDPGLRSIDGRARWFLKSANAAY